MKPDDTAKLVWQLSGREAMAAKFESIEPAHFFNAILKFAELEEKHYEVIIKDADIISSLLDTRKAVVERLMEISIEVPDISTKLRRNSRSAIGKGEYSGGERHGLHRSDGSREICKRAESIAEAANKSQWGVVELLDALLENPPMEIASALKEMNITVEKPSINVPLLEKHGRNLCSDLPGSCPGDPQTGKIDFGKDPACRVVTGEIYGKEKESVLLIKAGKREPREIVHAIARFHAEGLLPSSARNRKIFEIRISDIVKEIGADKCFEDLEDFFRNVAQAGNIILFINDFSVFIETDQDGSILGLLKEATLKNNFQCIAAVDSERYEKHMRDNTVWEKMFKIIWIHNPEIPLQL